MLMYYLALDQFLFNEIIHPSKKRLHFFRSTSDHLVNSTIEIRKQALSLFGISHAISSSANNSYKAHHFLDIVYLHVKSEWSEEGEEMQHVIDTSEHG